nr:helix-turn-helix domain-containing protein [Bacillus sp. AFS096315]
MKEKLYSIGEVSKLVNISIKALRYYDKINLFKPAYVDPDTNYRYYKDSQIHLLDLIKSLKYIGTPLEEMKEVQGLQRDEFFSFLTEQEKIVREKIDSLIEIEKIIANAKKGLQKRDCKNKRIILNLVKCFFRMKKKCKSFRRKLMGSIRKIF